MRKPRQGRIHPNQYGSPGSMGNTTGMIVPVDSPMAQKATVKPETPAEKGWWDSWGDTIHMGLDVVGMIPIVGEAADLANAAIYAAEGDYVNASISAASAVPGVGNAATAAKWAKRGVDAVDTANDLRKVDKATDAAQAAKRADDVPTSGGKPPGKDSGGKGKGKSKKKLDCGEGGSYADLLKKTGDGKYDRDHIPSKKAMIERARQLAEDNDLIFNKGIEQKIIALSDTIAIPRQAHIDISPTYGSRNKSIYRQDASDLAGAAKRDISEMLNNIDKYDKDGKCRALYKKFADEILKMTNDDFDKFLADILLGRK
jgi:hypothetical protein